MEYRKNSYTPRERIDDDVLLRILDEEEPIRCAYGNSCNNNISTRQSPKRGVTPRMENQDNGNNNGSCGADNCAKENCLSGYALAMVYTPDQEWREIYSEEDALAHGTLFAELFKPFYHGCCGNCR